MEAVKTTRNKASATPAAIHSGKDAGKEISGPYLFVQAKLSIGSPNDIYEKEADAMADRVMRMPEEDHIQRKCEECEKEEEVQRKPLVSTIQRTGSDEGYASDSVTNQINSGKGNGNNMDAATQ